MPPRSPPGMKPPSFVASPPDVEVAIPPGATADDRFLVTAGAERDVEEGAQAVLRREAARRDGVPPLEGGLLLGRGDRQRLAEGGEDALRGAGVGCGTRVRSRVRPWFRRRRSWPAGRPSGGSGSVCEGAWFSPPEVNREARPPRGARRAGCRRPRRGGRRARPRPRAAPSRWGRVRVRRRRRRGRCAGRARDHRRPRSCRPGPGRRRSGRGRACRARRRPGPRCARPRRRSARGRRGLRPPTAATCVGPVPQRLMRS
jgi:hypothetical protein